MTQTVEKQDAELPFVVSGALRDRGAEAWVRSSRIGFLAALVTVLSIIVLTGLARSILPFV